METPQKKRGAEKGGGGGVGKRTIDRTIRFTPEQDDVVKRALAKLKKAGVSGSGNAYLVNAVMSAAHRTLEEDALPGASRAELQQLLEMLRQKIDRLG